MTWYCQKGRNMKRLSLAAILTLVSSLSYAADQQCLAQKYDAYVDASLTWYSDLATLTTSAYPELKEVSQWFLAGRQHHFELNRVAVHYYLANEPAKVATAQPIEAWLQLEQKDIKSLALRDDELGRAAKITFDDRQAPPNEKNYQLRSALAELLSHPKTIDSALSSYNTKIEKIEQIICN
jgi:hypothetical protein